MFPKSLVRNAFKATTTCPIGGAVDEDGSSTTIFVWTPFSRAASAVLAVVAAAGGRDDWSWLSWNGGGGSALGCCRCSGGALLGVSVAVALGLLLPQIPSAGALVYLSARGAVSAGCLVGAAPALAVLSRRFVARLPRRCRFGALGFGTSGALQLLPFWRPLR